uniref:Uncharacterized protein n=1 Tax=Romanomermis culicivorax TaxID=13658 RepID=A0A915HNU1_ROMCU
MGELFPKDNNLQIALVENLYAILKSDSEKQAAEKAEQESQSWPQNYREYYFLSIAPAVCTTGKWVLEPLGLYFTFSGVTTNEAGHPGEKCL